MPCIDALSKRVFITFKQNSKKKCHQGFTAELWAITTQIVESSYPIGPFSEKKENGAEMRPVIVSGWNRYWKRAGHGQLLANFFPVPGNSFRSLC